MPGSWLFSLLFFGVFTIVLSTGIFTLQNNNKDSSNRVFFALTISIAFWSSGMALSTVARDTDICEIYRRFGAIGWSTAYAILLHFVLIITGRAQKIKSKSLYLLMYIPAVVCIFAFSIPNGLNPSPYYFQKTEYGWINTSQFTFWDWIFYAYYIGHTITALILLVKWGRDSQDAETKKQARIIYTSLTCAIVIGTFTDVIFSSQLSNLPQLAPMIILIPILATYHTLQKDKFGIIESVDKKTSYVSIFISIIIYITIAMIQMRFSNSIDLIVGFDLEQPVVRGVIVQIQMFISVYLVLKENRPGYIASVLLNTISLISAIGFFIKSNSNISMPGIISYSGVLVIITLIKIYKDKNAAYIKKIDAQAAKEKFFSSVFNQAPVGIAIINDKSHTRKEEFEDMNINLRYEQIMGRSKEELQKTSWMDITHPDDMKTDLELFEKFQRKEIDHYSIEKRYIRPDGSFIWTDMLVAPFTTYDGKSDDHFCAITDITKRKEFEENLKYNNEHDMLTGLYNRSVLEKTLEQEASKSSTGKRALICINLSQMHILSLRYGFHYSKRKLKEIVDATKEFCSDNYKLFNTYENHFVFYAKNYKDEKELMEFCENVSGKLNPYLSSYGINGGIGVVEINESNVKNVDQLMKMLLISSEIALRNNRKDIEILFYGEEIEARVTREIEISRQLEDIAADINTESMHLQYQPIVDIDTDHVSGFEALVRLNNEKYGQIAPDEFIAIAEKTNMIVILGEKIIKEALTFLKRLNEKTHEDTSVSINVSMIQLLKENFADNLLGMIREMDVDPKNIGVELTESVFALERKEVNKITDRLRAMGIKILIDDFGTGYSSFARQRELNIDCIKIDKSFVDRIMKLEEEETITGDIISMVHKMGHCAIAEGVEHEKQRQYLKNNKCDKVQGFFISKPLDNEDAIEFLKNY